MQDQPDEVTGGAGLRRWESIAARMSITGRAFVDGRAVDAAEGRVFEKRSPIDGRSIATVAEGRSEDVDRAVTAARRAFDAGAWSRQAPSDRRRVLLAVAARLEAHRDELAVLDTLESGKPITDAIAEVDRAVATFSFYAEAIDKRFGEVAPTPEAALGLVVREPVGVVGAVTPWNYPLTMPAWKLAPALAVGNSVVLKPAEQAPLCAIRLAEIAAEAGVPRGVLNVVPGFGETAGAALGRHHDVDTLTFTGSGVVGKAFLRYSGESNMKHVWLECGGKSPNVVLADAPDLEAVARATVEGVFSNAGQMCNAGSRLLVERSVHDELLDLVTQASAAWHPRHPFDADARMGAIIDEQQLTRILAAVRTGREAGAQLVLGGERALPETGGSYMAPTVLRDCEPGMAIMRDELFGPVLAVQAVDDLETAVRTANDSSYGLAAAVWTRDLRRAHLAARTLQAGSVYVNCFDQGDLSMPFGGHKQSGIGVDKSLYALDNYTQLKSVWIDLE